MVVTQDSPSARIRAKLNHPIVDADGHFNEVTDVLIDYIREVGGSEMADRYEQGLAKQKGRGSGNSIVRAEA